MIFFPEGARVMRRKYQKPIQLALSDLAPAKYSCSVGVEVLVQIQNTSGVDHLNCNVGASFGNELCGPFGISASSCGAFGATAGI